MALLHPTIARMGLAMTTFTWAGKLSCSMFIAARKLSAARSYFSLFSSASPSVVFYSESLILSFENNEFLALVFLSIEGFGCF